MTSLVEARGVHSTVQTRRSKPLKLKMIQGSFNAAREERRGLIETVVPSGAYDTHPSYA